jgi:urease accessory protein
METPMRFLLWQFIDSGFPSGGFAHSGGLEAAVQHGYVVDEMDLEAFALRTLSQMGRSALPLVMAAWRQPEDLPELDRLTNAFLSNPVANRASRAQGRALLTSALRLFADDSLAAIDERVGRERLAPHYAPIFGALLGAMDVSVEEAQGAFLFVTIRNVVSASIKLGLTGPYRALEIQARVAKHIDRVIADCSALGPHDIAQTAPLIDLFQSTHDRLYSRLFQS